MDTVRKQATDWINTACRFKVVHDHLLQDTTTTSTFPIIATEKWFTTSSGTWSHRWSQSSPLWLNLSKLVALSVRQAHHSWHSRSSHPRILSVLSANQVKNAIVLLLLICSQYSRNRRKRARLQNVWRISCWHREISPCSNSGNPEIQRNPKAATHSLSHRELCHTSKFSLRILIVRRSRRSSLMMKW